jgi:serine/threonine-protein kinase
MNSDNISHYRILKRLGAGGMGIVYLAKDEKLDRMTALKVMPSELAANEELMRRFIQEAKAASAINHPNVAHIYEIGEEDGVHFIAMEFIDGQTLESLINGRPLDIANFLDISVQLADALDEAHSRGITHRDIKPSNIIITPRGQAKVLDFGLAKMSGRDPLTNDSFIATARITEPGVVMGTVQYMSPEQALGKEVDHRSDIFSLGVVMYEMATGQLPFSGVSPTDTIVQITQTQPESVVRVNYRVPDEIDRIIRKCLEKERDRRFQTARDLLVDLKNFRRDSDSGITRKETRQPRGQTRRKKSIDSLAILPFVNLSTDPNMEYLSDGITENIISSLSQLPKLKVMARSTVFRYKGRDLDLQEVGRELSVQGAVTGRVLQVGDNLVITTELVNLSDGSQVWGGQYNRKVSDIFAVQEEIANEITNKLRLTLSNVTKKRLVKGYTADTTAYQSFLKGRYHFYKQTAEGFRKAVEFFQQAIAEDPNYAPAYAELANTYSTLLYWGFLPREETLPKMSEALNKALALDPSLAEAHLLMAKNKFHYEWDWAVADREFKKAIELNPNYAEARSLYAFYLADMGHFPEAIAEARRAQGLDPLSLFSIMGLGFVYTQARQYDNALEQGSKLLEMDPNFFGSHWLIGSAYYGKGMVEEAIVACQRAVTLGGSPMVSAFLGFLYGVSGRREEALKTIDQMKEMRKHTLIPPPSIAMIYAGLGEKDSAFEWLETAYEERNAMLTSLKVGNTFDNLRADPRFADLLNRIGLTR